MFVALVVFAMFSTLFAESCAVCVRTSDISVVFAFLARGLSADPISVMKRVVKKLLPIDEDFLAASITYHVSRDDADSIYNFVHSFLIGGMVFCSSFVCSVIKQVFISLAY